MRGSVEDRAEYVGKGWERKNSSEQSRFGTGVFT